MENKLNIGESVMDFSKKIDGIRFNLSQDKHNQVTIKKEKEIISIQNMDHKLELKEMQKMIINASQGKYPVIEPIRNEEKLNIEKPEIKEDMPTPHPCLFCGGIPKAICIRDAEGNNGNFRALQCTGNRCISSKSGARVTHKHWIYTVDIIDNDVDAADRKLILEWNKRMPLLNRGK